MYHHAILFLCRDMPVHPLNLELFCAINGSPDDGGEVLFWAQWCAENVIYLILVLPLMACLVRRQDKWMVLVQVLGAVAGALFLKHVIAEFYFHPRPFMLDVGHMLGTHDRTTSYPSAHGTLAFTVALGLCFAWRWLLGGVAVLLALAVAWSRIYLGIHFPFDMAAAFGVALASNLLTLLVIRSFRQTRYVCED
ncbi:MAG: phosphatase PAP2 family protein [Neisseria sp.]|nr:phosphatase PAP2 family protein [Neisseria sp.]